jgi:5-methylcytosine-specific restriction protein A
MAAPDIRTYLIGLTGQTLMTMTGKPNRVVSVGNASVMVATEGNRDGAPVSIALVQDVADRVFAGEEVKFDPQARSAFVGAVLQTMPEVEVLSAPRRARLRGGLPAVQVNPDWTFDELILALDLYLRWRPKQPPSGHPDLRSLSDLLRRLPLHAPETRAESFRNANSARRKLGDFTDPDPDYVGKGTKGGEGVHLVWAQFAGRPEALAAAVERITASADGLTVVLPPEEGETTAVEGRIVFREHRARERDPRLVRAKKDTVLRATGRLACEACDLDFSERYGALGEGFIECHHTVPLGQGSERVTSLAELALLCPNCHRMVHRAPRPLTVVELRELLS